MTLLPAVNIQAVVPVTVDRILAVISIAYCGPSLGRIPARHPTPSGDALCYA